MHIFVMVFVYVLAGKACAVTFPLGCTISHSTTPFLFFCFRFLPLFSFLS